MQHAHNPKHSPNISIAVAHSCTTSEVPLFSLQQHKGVNMNVPTYVIAHSMRASISHAFGEHRDHCGSKCVNHFNELLYPRRCLCSKTAHHMPMPSAHVRKVLRSRTHVHACSFCCTGDVRMHGLKCMLLHSLASCRWDMRVVCACMSCVLCLFFEFTCENLHVCPSLKIATVSSLQS